MGPERHTRGYTCVQGAASREAVPSDERRRQQYGRPEGAPPEGDGNGGGLGQPDEDGGRRDGQHPHGYDRESVPTPCLILYQTRAPLSLTNCPLRNHFLRHIGLLYTGSATASRPTLPKEATVLTQCNGSVTTRTSPMPLCCTISATLTADSQVLLAVSSRRIAASGTPISRRMADITTASPGGCSPSPPVGTRRSARPRTYNSPAWRVLASSVGLGLPPGSTWAPRTTATRGLSLASPWSEVDGRPMYTLRSSPSSPRMPPRNGPFNAGPRALPVPDPLAS